jgi:hypothetical protein
VNGQLVRVTANKIHIVRQTSATEPVLRNDGWEVHDIAEVFDDRLLAALENPTRATVDPPPRDER